MSETWHILGVGSIGGLFAHRLHQSGANVCLLSRSSSSNHRAISLLSSSRKTATSEQTVTFDSSNVNDRDAISHLLITAKSWAAGLALKQIRHRISDTTHVVAMMNGMQHIDDIREVVPNCNLFLASTTAGCHRAGGKWVVAGEGKTLVGHPSGDASPSWFSTWQRGIPSLDWCKNINERLVEKVAINACINPLTAIHRVQNGALLREPFQAKSALVIKEVTLILGELGYSKVASHLENTAQSVMEDTAQNTSSMLSDVLAGRRTEADSIVGWLLNQTTGHYPQLRALLSQLRSIEPSS